jgi:hypothetical protein
VRPAAGRRTLIARFIRQLLLAQTAERLAWLERWGEKPPRGTSIVIGDLKGEPALFHEVYDVCLALRIPFKFFTDQFRRSSYVFNPLSQKHLVLFTTSQLAQIILEGAGLTC